eukprot:jgi/Hompol1/3365/HPOL_003224-RA
MSDETLLLPSYFPLKLRKCAAPADSFFTCFETESIPNGEADVARNAVSKCREQLIAYKECMDNFVGPKAAARSELSQTSSTTASSSASSSA